MGVGVGSGVGVEVSVAVGEGVFVRISVGGGGKVSVDAGTPIQPLSNIPSSEKITAPLWFLSRLFLLLLILSVDTGLFYHEAWGNIHVIQAEQVVFHPHLSTPGASRTHNLQLRIPQIFRI